MGCPHCCNNAKRTTVQLRALTTWKMGLDGGTVITRSDVLRGQSWRVANQDTSRSTRGGSVSGLPAAKPAEEQHAERVASWTTCSISGETLHAPVVADVHGRLFNKDSVVELLLARKDIFVDGQRSVHQHANRLRKFGPAFDSLRSLKDVFQVHLEQQAEGTQEQTARPAQQTQQVVPYFCPITGLPCTRFPFAALRRCGHVLSQRALLALTPPACPLCGKGYTEQDKVPINGPREKAQEGKAAMQGAADRQAQEGPPCKKRKQAPQEHQENT